MLTHCCQASGAGSTKVLGFLKFTLLNLQNGKEILVQNCREIESPLCTTYMSLECDFIVHRKCEQKVVIDCSARLEQAVLQHDKQVEESVVPDGNGGEIPP